MKFRSPMKSKAFQIQPWNKILIDCLGVIKLGSILSNHVDRFYSGEKSVPIPIWMEIIIFYLHIYWWENSSNIYQLEDRMQITVLSSKTSRLNVPRWTKNMKHKIIQNFRSKQFEHVYTLTGSPCGEKIVFQLYCW